MRIAVTMIFFWCAIASANSAQRTVDVKNVENVENFDEMPLADLHAAYSFLRDGENNRAEQLLTDLARRGEPRAQAALGLLYARGDRVQRDLIAGYAWLTVAARSGHSDWKDAVLRLENELAGSVRAKARREARKYLREYPTDWEIVCSELVVPASDLPYQCREPEDARGTGFRHSLGSNRQLGPGGPGFRAN